MASNVSEKEARQVAESAREQGWEKPSFGKELFLGNLRLDLIHPQPKLDPAAVEKGEGRSRRARRSSRACASSSSSRSTRSRSSATRRSPTRWSTGSRSSARSA